MTTKGTTQSLQVGARVKKGNEENQHKNISEDLDYKPVLNNKKKKQ